jgi:putative glutamine amidotransferase
VSSAFEEFGAHVVRIDTTEKMRKVLPYVDAIALTGGGDVDPERYGAKPHRQNYGTNVSRDDREFEAVKYAQENGLPMFGICRGLQLLNVAHGGSLDQHISDNDESFSHEGTNHFVKLRRHSRFAQATGLYGLIGTHLHHQRIERLGDGLVPAGWAHDGTIEFIESAPNSESIVLATQFHPEMDYAYDDDAGEVFKHFVTLVGKRMRPDVLGRWKRLSKTMYPITKYTGTSTNPTQPKGVWTKHTDGSWGYETARGGTGSTTTGLSDEEKLQNWLRENEDDDDYEFEEWKRLNDGAWVRDGDHFAESRQEMCDRKCAFPPCSDVTGCTMYDDCAAESLALKEAAAASRRMNDVQKQHTKLTTMTVDEYERMLEGKRGNPRG